MKFLYQMFVFGLLLISSTQVNGQVTYVKPDGVGDGSSWQNAYGDLHLAINNAAPGSQIWIAKGTYHPTHCISCDSIDKSKSFLINKPVQIFGGFTGFESDIKQRNPKQNITILSGDIDRDGSLENNSFTILEIDHSNEGLLLDGLWFVMGNANGGGPLGEPTNSGSAIYINGQFQNQESFSVFSNCVFQDNFAKGFGGAVYLAATFNGHINSDFTNCIFRKNRSENDGGAINANASFEGLVEANFSYCHFLNNGSLEKSGGAVYLSGSEQGAVQSKFDSNVFYKNSAKQYGGAFYAFGKSGSCNPFLQFCTFEANHAEQGGAMYNNGSFSGESSPELQSCWFKSNQAQLDGGAVYCLGSPNGISNGSFKKCFFIQNTCGASGAAVFNNGSMAGACNPVFNSCRFFENSTPNYGGAVYNLGLRGNSSPSFFNSLFYNNSAYSAGAIYNLGADHGNASPLVVHCTFIENKAEVGGALYNNASDSTGLSDTRVYNSLFQKNHAPTGDVFRNIFSHPEIAYSLVDVQGCNQLNDGVNSTISCGDGMIFSVNQQMADPLNERFHLNPGVESIGAGSGDIDSIYLLFSDLVGNQRTSNPAIGCLEYQDSNSIKPIFLDVSDNMSLCQGEDLKLKMNPIDSFGLEIAWYFNEDTVENRGINELMINNADFENTGIYKSLIHFQSDTFYGNPVSVFVSPDLQPEINLTLSDTAICQSDTIYISREVGNLTESLEFFYYLDGHHLSWSQNAKPYLSPSPGRYLFEVFVMGKDSCSEILNKKVYSRFIEVHSDTIPLLNIIGPDTLVCEGEEVNLSLKGEDVLETEILWFVNDELEQQGGKSFTSNNFEGLSTVIAKWKCQECICIPENEFFESRPFLVQTKECLSEIKDIFSNSRFSIYPNPSTGELRIKTGDDLLKTIRVFDASGNKLYEQKVMHQKETFSVRIDNNITGLSLVLLEFESRTEYEWILLSE
ncbi:MAG: hypothetical protein R2769_00935 [Saprospiraceae bacterium]